MATQKLTFYVHSTGKFSFQVPLFKKVEIYRIKQNQFITLLFFCSFKAILILAVHFTSRKSVHVHCPLTILTYTILLGNLYMTILTYTNYFYLGSPVMPLAVNIHERKFKSSHSMFWTREGIINCLLTVTEF